MPALSELTTLHAPPLHSFREGEIAYFVDADAPNWVAVDGRGADLIVRGSERSSPNGPRPTLSKRARHGSTCTISWWPSSARRS